MAKARTSVMIDAALLKRARLAAVERETSLSRVFEDCLELGLIDRIDTEAAKKGIEELFAWADRAKLCSEDGPLTREQAHER
jgi:hypothetical protein